MVGEVVGDGPRNMVVGGGAALDVFKTTSEYGVADYSPAFTPEHLHVVVIMGALGTVVGALVAAFVVALLALAITRRRGSAET